MMYRSGWASRPGQERVLTVTITRDGFEWALAHSSLSHFLPGTYANEAEWAERKAASPVRVQWDPERSLLLEPLAHRTIQIGLGEGAVRRYVEDWITSVADLTPLAHEIRSLVTKGQLGAARAKLPHERTYPLPEHLRRVVAAT